MFNKQSLLLLLSGLLLSDAGAVPRYASIANEGTVKTTTYDFVIVGGGVSGLTVADRLTEDPNSQIQLFVARCGDILTSSS
jgi:choline dehydrogenase